MSYKLLIFNQDWADEHNVPALACMTEEEYNIWLTTPSGELNPNYEKQNEEYQRKLNDYKNFIKELQVRNLYTKKTSDFTEEEKKWYEENKKPYIYDWDSPKRVSSNMNARLGNGGEGFEENYGHLYLMKEFVEAGIVKVFDVSEDFYNTFHKAKLSDLSLCNVFCIEDY